jgi:hypothetical protein
MPAALGLLTDQFWSIDIFGIAFFIWDEDFYMVSGSGRWPENGMKIEQSSKRDSAASRTRDRWHFTNEAAGDSEPCCRTGIKDTIERCGHGLPYPKSSSSLSKTPAP